LAPVRQDAWQAVAIVALLVLAVFGFLAAKLALAMVGRNCAEVAAVKAHAEAEAAKLLCEAQERFHMVVQANANGLLVVDTAGRIVMANPALESMFGYAKDELLGQPLEILLPESARREHAGHFAAYLRAPVAKPMGAGRDLHGQRKDGGVFPVEISLSPFTENGKQYVDAIVADISERKRIETLHLQGEARLQLLVQNNPNGMLVVDAQGRIVMANPALEKMFGYAKDELLDQPLGILLPETANDQHERQVASYMRSPIAKPMGTGRDLRGRRKDGSVFPVEISLSSFTEDGKQYVDAIIADISERKRLETLHQQGEARMQLLNPNGLLIVDDEGKIRLANPALERMFGYEHGELVGQPLERLVPDTTSEQHKVWREAFQVHPSTRPMGAALSLQGRRKDGSGISIEVILSGGSEDGRAYVQATVLDKTLRA
jgi:PAS domain S-box-containing protein